MDLDLSPGRREELLQYLGKEAQKRDISILSTAPQYARVCSGLPNVTSLTHFDSFGQNDDMDEDIDFLAEFVGGCGIARLYCVLEPNGDIEPCVFLPIKLGNIKKNELAEVWQNNQVMKDLRNRKEFKGKRRTCEHRNICGGCRARAYGYYNDAQQSDPGCIINKKAWKEIKHRKN